ncbi:hypothetical protein AUC43_17295 [Hymenobacter sedentarius]|uniref:Creatininase n=1 Tax=Hymenobacter sedentarius TaxID=1411621 RepID=A0A0U4CEV2_9BACT|nr:creatininase family protein [Hymenobacter sedentarius]ALW86681.1 hypothetical protein AUC43_17295 [Hymenobacter sedentarius]
MRSGKKLGLLSLLVLRSVFSHGQQATTLTRPNLFVEYLTTFEVSEKIQQGYTTVLVYSGGQEATGPHVALGKHNFRVPGYAQRIAARLGHTLIAPIIPFAPNSPALQKWAGTVTLDSLTFSKVNEALATSMITSGFTRIILLGDHGPSQAPLAALARKMEARYRGQGIDVYYAADGYTTARKQIEASLKRQGLVGGGHGGNWDVSETMVVSRRLVRPRLFAAGDTARNGNTPMNARGLSGDPTRASKKRGKQFGEVRVGAYVDEIKRHLAALGAGSVESK